MSDVPNLLCTCCGTANDVWQSNCTHLPLCRPCGGKMKENGATCPECGSFIERLVKEFPIIAAAGSSDKKHFVGSFPSGVPQFSDDFKWSVQKEGHQESQVVDALQEEKMPWILADKTGQTQYHGQLEGAQSASDDYLLMQEGDVLAAVPVTSTYRFDKVAQNKQLTLEEAEERMEKRKKTLEEAEVKMEKRRRKTADGVAAFFGGKETDDKEESFDEDDDGTENSSKFDFEKVFSDDEEELHPNISQEEEGGLKRLKKLEASLLGPITMQEIMAEVEKLKAVSVKALAETFSARLKLPEELAAFADTVDEMVEVHGVLNKGRDHLLRLSGKLL